MLLLSLKYEGEQHEKGPRYWIDQALNSAVLLGLNRSRSPRRLLTVKQRLERRIWWSCYMRDRLNSLTTLTPFNIKDCDFNIPLLDANDFSSMDEYGSSWHGDLLDRGQWQQLSLLSIKLARLCLRIGCVLDTLYVPVVISLPRCPGKTKSVLIPKAETPASFQQRWKILKDWKASKYDCNDDGLRGARSGDDLKDIVFLQDSFLDLVHCATMVVAHGMSPFHDSDADSARGFALQSAKIISSIQQYGQTRLLSLSGMAVLIPSLIFHLQDMVSGLSSNPRATIASLLAILKTFEVLRDMYHLADHVLEFVHRIQLHLNLPGLEFMLHRPFRVPSVLPSSIFDTPNYGSVPQHSSKVLRNRDFWESFHFVMIENLSWSTLLVDRVEVL